MFLLGWYFFGQPTFNLKEKFLLTCSVWRCRGRTRGRPRWCWPRRWWRCGGPGGSRPGCGGWCTAWRLACAAQGSSEEALHEQVSEVIPESPALKDLFRESNVYKMEDGSLKAVLLLQSHKKIYLYISDFLFTQCRLGHVSASFLSNRLDSGNMNNIDEITSKLRSSDVVGRCPGKMDCQVTNVICLGCV